MNGPITERCTPSPRSPVLTGVESTARAGLSRSFYHNGDVTNSMLKRIDIGTDIAIIGVWDPARERHDLRTAKLADFEAGLQTEAQDARLFYINTGADGSYLTDIYIEEEPDPERLTAYSAVEREFLITSESGRLIAGGVEDFVSPTKQITSDNDQFSVSPGLYAIRVYELIEEKLIDRIRNHVGEEDYAYYESKSAGFPWGYLLFVITIGFLFTKLWFVAVALFAIGLAYLVIRSHVRSADKRFQDIAQRVAAFDSQYPPFIYVLRSMPPVGDVKGGWHNLN